MKKLLFEVVSRKRERMSRENSETFKRTPDQLTPSDKMNCLGGNTTWNLGQLDYRILYKKTNVSTSKQVPKLLIHDELNWDILRQNTIRCCLVRCFSRSKLPVYGRNTHLLQKLVRARKMPVHIKSKLSGYHVIFLNIIIT